MSDAVGTTQVPAVATPLVTQRAGERHPGPDDVSHAAPSPPNSTSEHVAPGPGSVWHQSPTAPSQPRFMFLLPHVVPTVSMAGAQVPPTPVTDEAPSHVRPAAQIGSENAPHAAPASTYGSHTSTTLLFQMQARPCPHHDDGAGVTTSGPGERASVVS